MSQHVRWGRLLQAPVGRGSARILKGASHGTRPLADPPIVLARLHCAVVIAVVAVMVPVGVPAASAQTATAETYWVDAVSGIDLPTRGSQTEPFATITYAAS